MKVTHFSLICVVYSLIFPVLMKGIWPPHISIPFKLQVMDYNLKIPTHSNQSQNVQF